MNQQLVSSRFPYLPIHVESGNMVYEGYALLDTGFTGEVILPPWYLPDDASLIGSTPLTLPDGRRTNARTYTAILTLGRLRQFRVSVSAFGSEPIIGVHVIRHFSVILDHGRRVIVEP